MKALLQKIKLFYVKVTKKEETYKRREIRPSQDWSVLLIVNFVILCALIIFASYFYIQIQREKLFSITETNILNEEKINMDLLTKTINDINAREKLTSNIKNNRVRYSDPSM
ncbi:MAG: hypothetical protein NTX96_02565 [Candidatus Zambryskibacteria bacterium]|nr:hypothetical protein [Candidatus Zambryskibacteria bacterium]